MMFRILSRRALLSAIISTAILPSLARGQGPVAFAKDKLSIDTTNGRKTFDVELALSDRQHSQGLMYRRKLRPDAGMLFDYRYSQRITMWMRNTYIPLDMIFIGADGRVVNITERAIPLSDAIIASKGRVRAVLEVNGGTVSRLGIRSGAKVYHRIFGTAP